MIAIGLTFAWLAVQVSIVLGAGIVAYALAARRGPAAGASVAALGLGMVVALSVAAFLPVDRIEPRRIEQESASIPARTAGAPAGTLSGGGERPSIDRARFDRWRFTWDQLGRGAAGPVSRCRPWAGGLAVLFLGGTALGLVRMAVGIVAIIACRRRGRAVNDPAMIGMLDELRGAVGCRRAVELREVDDLAGPATAGWRRPLILLPDDWRSWDESERRAVLAHELAHVVRGDYAAGLVARMALALHGYHPMVWWLAGRLRLQQEMAADAIGARHAGGRDGYLVALSRLALRQDGRSPRWPARAFLPARGTLIRRITMLRDETRNGTIERPWTRAPRLATTALLLGLTAAAMTLRGPAQGGEEGAPAGAPSSPAAVASMPPIYVSDGMSGVAVLRPAAAARHAGLDRLETFLLSMWDIDFSTFAKDLRVDRNRPDFLKLGMRDIDYIVINFRSKKMKDKAGKELHGIEFPSPALRTVAPFDWLAFLRQWRFGFAEVREANGRYYKIQGLINDAIFQGEGGVYLPDDRTIVFGLEKTIRKLVRGEVPPLPSYLRGPEWERACRGLIAVALSNQGGSLAKDYDLGGPDDAIILQLFQGVDCWILGVDDADSIALHATAIPAPGASSEPIARTVSGLVKQYRDPVDRAVAAARPGEFEDPESLLSRALVDGLRVEPSDRSVTVHAGGLGTIADFAAMIEDVTRREKKPPKP